MNTIRFIANRMIRVCSSFFNKLGFSKHLKKHQQLHHRILVSRLSLISTVFFSFTLGSSIVCADWKITNSGIGEFASWATDKKVEVLTGDFNGDGSTDVALLRREPGWTTMPVALSNKDGSWTITNNDSGAFASFATERGAKVLTGDFDCNGTTDVALLNRNPGWNTIPVAFSNKDGSWQSTNLNGGDFASFATGDQVAVLTGRFTGRKVVGSINDVECTDIALLNMSAGPDSWNTMPMAFFDSTTGMWKNTNGAIGSFASSAQIPGIEAITGDFNNDGFTDVALLKLGPNVLGNTNHLNGIPLALSDGNGGWTIVSNSEGTFTWFLSHTRDIPEIYTGDFDGDGLTDIARRLATPPPGDPEMAVALSRSGGTTWQIAQDSSAWWSESAVTYMVGNFDDNKSTTEIALLKTKPGWNTMPVGSFRSDGSFLGFTNCSIGGFSSFATGENIMVLNGDFDGDGRTDVALLNRNPGWNTMPIAFSRPISQACAPPPTPPPDPCLQACIDDRDLCMKGGGEGPRPRPAQCLRDFNQCKLECSNNSVAN